MRNEFFSKQINLENLGKEKQKSLPAYIYGLKLAQMCKELEKVKCFGKG